MKRSIATAIAALALCGLPALASAEEAYTVRGVNLRAGPDVGYPRVEYVPAGEPVDVVGCLEDYSWCDVIAADERGWIAADFLEYEYDGRRVLIPEYGPQLGFGIVGFSFGSYWDSHYRHRSWYGERSRWNSYAYSHPHHFRNYSYRNYGPSYRGGTSYYRGGTYDRGGTRYDRSGTTYRRQTQYDTRNGTSSYVAPQSRTESRSYATRPDYRRDAQSTTELRQRSAATSSYQGYAADRARQQREAQSSEESARSQRQIQQRQLQAERQDQRSERQIEQRQAQAQRQDQRVERQVEQRQAQAQRQDQRVDRQIQQRQFQAAKQEQRVERQAQQQQQHEQVRAEVAQQHQNARNEREAQREQRQYARKKNKDDKD